jgi:hypothetical protein
MKTNEVREVGFPVELLSQPAEARLKYFKNKIIGHRNLLETHEKLMDKIHDPGGASLILVFGPTGVGKTTLLDGAEKQIIEEMLPQLEQDPGCIPIAKMEVISPVSGSFDWKEFFREALTVLLEPSTLLDHKIVCDGGFHRREDGTLDIPKNLTGLALRRSLRNALKYRKLLAFLLDEAQHLGKVAGGKHLKDQMDAVKSLANMTATLFCLAGTYELLDLTDLSSQLGRRSRHIHFQRYQFTKSDLAVFDDIIKTFEYHLPLTKVPDLLGYRDYLYEGSLGCVGVLKDWLYDALGAALKEGREELTEKHLRETAMPAERRLMMARDNRLGEGRVAESKEHEFELRRVLGMPETDPGDSTPKEKDKQSSKSSQRPGQRSPTRDLVGVEAYGG